MKTVKAVKPQQFGFFATQWKWLTTQAFFVLIEKARQVGCSWAHGFWGVNEAMGLVWDEDRQSWYEGQEPRDTYYLSSKEPKAAEWIKKQVVPIAKFYNESCRLLYKETLLDVREGRDIKKLVVEFPKYGTQVVAMAANPDSARSSTGNTILDEFGYAEKAREIYAGAMGQTTRGFKGRVVSTHNGVNCEFYKLATNKKHDALWECYKYTIIDHRDEGGCTDADVQRIRSMCLSEAHWRQDFLCEPTRAGANAIDLEARDAMKTMLREPQHFEFVNGIYRAAA